MVRYKTCQILKSVESLASSADYEAYLLAGEVELNGVLVGTLLDFNALERHFIKHISEELLGSLVGGVLDEHSDLCGSAAEKTELFLFLCLNDFKLILGSLIQSELCLCFFEGVLNVAALAYSFFNHFLPLKNSKTLLLLFLFGVYITCRSALARRVYIGNLSFVRKEQSGVSCLAVCGELRGT